MAVRARPRAVPPHRAVAAFDSASAMLRATARALRGQDFAHLGQSVAQALAVRSSGVLPLRPRQDAYALSAALGAVPQSRLGGVDLERVAAWTVGHYPARRYPAVVIGASNGAVVHLAAALGAPWLPQTLLVPVRWDGGRKAPVDALEFGARTAPRLLERNPDVVLHHMHDCNQDPLMLRHMAYFRVKRRRLGPAYERFLADGLQPGAPIVLVEDRSTWPVTRVGPRHVFQHGAYGGMGPPEYAAAPGATRPDDEAPEAEWGSDPALSDHLRDWAARHGHPLHTLVVDWPDAASPVVADLYRDRLRAAGADGGRLLVESFIVMDPGAVLRTASVPFWTPFPVRSAADALDDYLRRAEPYDEIDVMLFSHGVRSTGLADADVWRGIAGRARHRGGLLAVDERRFPADFAVLARYGPALRRRPDAAVRMSHLGVDDLSRHLQSNAYDGVRWEVVR